MTGSVGQVANLPGQISSLPHNLHGRRGKQCARNISADCVLSATRVLAVTCANSPKRERLGAHAVCGSADTSRCEKATSPADKPNATVHRAAGTGPFFGPSTYTGASTPPENMDLSPSFPP